MSMNESHMKAYTVRTPTTLTYVRVVQDGRRYVTLSSFWGFFVDCAYCMSMNESHMKAYT